MYVIGFNKIIFSSFIFFSEILPENLLLYSGKSHLSLILSTIEKPILCRVLKNSSSGFPSPTIRIIYKDRF